MSARPRVATPGRNLAGAIALLAAGLVGTHCGGPQRASSGASPTTTIPVASVAHDAAPTVDSGAGEIRSEALVEPAPANADAAATEPAEAGLTQVLGILVFRKPDPVHGSGARMLLLREAATKTLCQDPPDEAKGLIATMRCTWRAGAKCTNVRLRIVDGGTHRFGAALRIRKAPTKVGAIGEVEIVPSKSNTVALGNGDALVCD